MSSHKDVEEANADATDGGKYTFECVLGKGSFGTVLKARTEGDRQVAVKIVKAKKSLLAFFTKRKPSALTDAQQEVDLLLQLKHPSVVSLETCYEFKGRHGVMGLCMVMEYCSNGSLQTRLEHLVQESQRLDIDARCRWYKQLSSALHFIHSKSIVHRDIKPPNILLDAHDEIKMADVGLAKVVWDVRSQVKELPEDTTFLQYMSTITGTPTYMAPEIWEEHYKMPSDVYSLGLVFLMISELPLPPIPCGHWETRNNCLGVITHQHEAARKVPPTSLITPPVQHSTPSEIELFDDMLQHDYHQRPNMEGVIAAIDGIIQEASAAKPPSPQPPATTGGSWCHII